MFYDQEDHKDVQWQRLCATGAKCQAICSSMNPVKSFVPMLKLELCNVQKNFQLSKTALRLVNLHFASCCDLITVLNDLTMMRVVPLLFLFLICTFSADKMSAALEVTN